MRILTQENLKQIESLITELDLLIENKNLSVVDFKRREIKRILTDYKTNYGWVPDEETNNKIYHALLNLRSKCRNFVEEKYGDLQTKRIKQEQDKASENINNIKPKVNKKVGPICVSCGDSFDQGRKDLGISTCLKCGEIVATRSSARINEGIAGTREENKKMNAQIWGEMRNRSRGN